MTPVGDQLVARNAGRPSKTEFARACTVAVIQEAVLLGLGYLGSNWPGYPVTPSGKMLSGLILSGGAFALVYAAGLAAALMWFEFRVKSKRADALMSGDARKFAKLFEPPSVPTLALLSLLLWVSNVVVLGMMIAKSGEDAAIFILMGLTFGTIVWGTLTFALGLLLRALVIRLFRST